MTNERILSPEDIADVLGRHRPTPEQSQIISLPLKPRLVVAGAGSGKTATMVDRVVWLVANGYVRADEVLGVTFTRKAAGELRERMRSGLETLRAKGLMRVAEGAEHEVTSTDPVVSTYHSYANTLVQNYGLRIGIEQDAQMLGQTQSWQLVAQLVEFYEGELPEKAMAKSTLISAVMKLAGDCSEHLVSTEHVREFCLQQQTILKNLEKPGAVSKRNGVAQNIQARLVVADLVERYVRLKKSMQVLDYGDLIANAARIARDVPQAAAAERDRFKVVLLDEFQDTSHAQMKLFSDLFGATQRAVDAERRAEHPVMAVGDPKQSIYGFRGASDGQLFSFYDFFPTDDTTPSYLSVAWRNDTSILAAANRVAEPLKEPAKWVRASNTIDLPDLKARPKPGTGQVLVGTYISEETEADAIATLIAERRASFADKPLHQMPTMAVLTRAKSSMEPLRQAFERADIPYQVVGLGGLLDTPEIVDLVSIMHVLSDPGRSDALMRILSGARWRIGVSDLLVLAEWARFLEKRRELLVREGIELDIAAMGEGLDLEELYAVATQSAQSAEELIAEHSRSKSAASRAKDEHTRRQAREKWASITAAAESDIADNSSLIEAVENLPPQGWVSPASGRSFTDTGYARLSRIAYELAYLREFMADDLNTLMYRIEETTLMDIEVAAKSPVNSQTARRHLDAFHDVASSYLVSAPRINATLLAGRDGVATSVDSEGEQVQFSLNTSSASANGVSGFLAWCEQAAQQENGLETAGEEPRHDAVQILTVHASKGLEWDHVYIPAMSTGKFPSTKDNRWTQNAESLPWALRGDHNYLPPWEATPGTLRELDEELALFKEQADEHALGEERRLAYVGFTRARSLLVLSASSWIGSTQKPAETSIFLQEQLEIADSENAEAPELIAYATPEEIGEENPQRAAITTALWPFDPLDGPVTRTWDSQEDLDAAGAEAALEGRNVEHSAPAPHDPALHFALSRRARLERAAHNVFRGGLEGGEPQPDSDDPLDYVRDESAEQVAAWRDETELLLSILNAPQREKTVELPGHMSASQLVSLSSSPKDVIEQLRRPMPMRPTLSARQGTAFHLWIENHYESAAMLDLGEDIYADDEVEESFQLETLKNNFLGSRWAHLTPWAVEYPIETPVDGISVRGRVDAIFKRPLENGEVEWELVDWKSGRVPTDSELKHREVQLAVYRLGFSRLMDVPLENIRATFYYVAHDYEHSPEDVRLADEKKLTQLIKKARRLGAS